jgi:gas vesicle structural protein
MSSALATTTRGGNGASGYLQRAPGPSGLAEVIDLILDKGLVIDAYVRVSLVGIELLTIDARIVIASVDTYLRFAEAVDRLRLEERDKDLPELLDDGIQSGAASKTKGALQGAGEETKEQLEESRRKIEEKLKALSEKTKEKVGGGKDEEDSD